MTFSDRDLELILINKKRCATCKYYKADLMLPTESNNTWESWFDYGFEDDDKCECIRFPPVFIGGKDNEKDSYGEFNHSHWQYPSIPASQPICGEYRPAEWIPEI